MAKIIVCDRCGKQVPDVPDFCNIKMSIYPNGYKGYELCSDCAKALQGWFDAFELTKSRDVFEHGEIHKNNKYSLWYEPITDEVDGVVIRDENNAIVCVFA